MPEVTVLRKILLNIHIYGGLICFSYLILFGISTLNFGHPYSFTHSPPSVTVWSQPLSPTLLSRTDGKSAAESQTIRRQNNEAVLHTLHSFTTPLNDSTGRWTDADTYHVHFIRPGLEYDIDAHPSHSAATITRTRAGFWALIRDLHGSSIAYTGSFFASTWSWYTELCDLVVIVAGITGIYLWAVRRRDRRPGLVTLAIAGVISVVLMLLVTFGG